MVILLNAHDWLGVALQDSLVAANWPCLVMHSNMLPQQLALRYNSQIETIVFKGDEYPVSDCKAIYCGHVTLQKYIPLKCQHAKDQNYVVNAWNAWLHYFCGVIPRKVGVLPSRFWLGTPTQLPMLYHRAQIAGIICPEVYFSSQKANPPHFTSWIGLNTLSPKSVADFSGCTTAQIFVQDLPGCWMQVLVVGESLFAVQQKGSTMQKIQVAKALHAAIVRLLNILQLPLATIVFKVSGNRYVLYALSTQADPVFAKYYLQEVVTALKEYLTT